MLRVIPSIIFLCFTVINYAESADLRYIQYDGFQIVLNCETKSAIRFSYHIGPDTGKLKRRSSFSLDPNLSKDCQQYSGKTYKNPKESFDRGHLVPANHLDGLVNGIHQSNYITNILPQARNMNRGAWLRTEEIIECYREKGDLKVYGGPIYSSDRSRDYFKESHGVITPNAFWKVIITKDDQIAWIIPNTSEATRSKLHDYLVSIDRIQKLTGERFQIISNEKKVNPASVSWKIPAGCDRS